MSISDLWSNTDLCATCWKSNFAECRVRLQKTAVSKCIQIFTFMLQSMHDGVIWGWINVLNGKGRQSLVVALADGWPIKGVSWVTGFSRNDGKPDMSGYLYQEDFTIEFSFSFFFWFQHQMNSWQCYAAARDEDWSPIMKARVRICLPNYCTIFLFLAMFILILMLRNMDVLEVRTWF